MADPNFQTDRLFTRLSAREFRHQLIVAKGYTDAELPTQQTINKKAQMRPKGQSRLPERSAPSPDVVDELEKPEV